ncbi:Rho termination factor N-terminal domain-containing protein, partial [Halomonas sp.]|uniref:Rho termination factor N-terminal domain-containing protein n=1 Tax=Halomonas sp. TaxID=1486246 RepID=UPI0025BDB26A
MTSDTSPGSERTSQGAIVSPPATRGASTPGFHEQSLITPMNLTDLKQKSVPDLLEIAREMGIDNLAR